MPLDRKLTKFTTASPKLVNYPAADLITGFGVVKFSVYAYIPQAGNKAFALMRDAFTSSVIETGTSVSPLYDSEIPAKHLDQDFDLPPFQIPHTLFGTARIYSAFASVKSAGNSTLRTYFIYRLRKYSGTTETEIASVQTETVDGNGPDRSLSLLDIPITTRTHFKKGDILRLTIESWMCKGATGDNAQGRVYYGVDPLNRDGTYLTPSSDTLPFSTTKTEIYIPFETE